MRARAALSMLLVGACVCASPGVAQAALSARPEVITRDGATRLIVTITSTTGFTAKTRPRGVKITAGGLRFVLRATGARPRGSVWTTSGLRGPRGAALTRLAGKRAVIAVRTRTGTTTLRRRMPAVATPAVPALPPNPSPPVGPPQPPVTGPQPLVEATPGVPKSEQALAVARRYLGTPFLWGGSSPETGFDAPGLTQYAYGQVGVELPRTADLQIAVGAEVSRDALRLGDLVFFRDPTGYVYHVGLYAGDSSFLHAPRTGDVIKYSSLNEPFYANQFTSGRHIAG